MEKLQLVKGIVIQLIARLSCFKKHKMIAIDLSKQYALHGDSKAIQQRDFS